MATIPTVTGPADTSDLGFTLMHEHVFVLSDGVAANFPRLWPRDERVQSAISELKEAKAHGVSTIVDLTVLGLGRDVKTVREIAQASGMRVIVATGLYTYNELPHHFDSRDADYMAAQFIADIEEGIQGTDIRAGILKCATDEPGVTPGVEKVLRGVARAHRRTGVPISTHTHAATKRGLEQQDVFEQEGVDLHRVVIGHSGDSEDIDYLETLMKRGSYIGMDRFGIDVYLPTEKRIATIAKLCERGHADQMVLSHDASCHIDWFDSAMLKQFAPRWNFLHISDDVVPALKEAGVSEADVRTMTVDNPRRIFEAHGAY
ncbi:MAG TPA: phosphotriesterase-related protein [Dehalococcoidia bacterium]|nr:phosphotriesterase-related protein [Dehalococcoidia bacterium]